ncbi:unnamed protein product [Prunus brigantina]
MRNCKTLSFPSVFLQLSRNQTDSESKYNGEKSRSMKQRGNHQSAVAAPAQVTHHGQTEREREIQREREREKPQVKAAESEKNGG